MPHDSIMHQAHDRGYWSLQMEHAFAMQMNFTSLALILKDEATIARILRENNRFNNTMARIEEAAPPEERELIQLIRTAQEEAMTTVADIANLVREGRLDEATKLQVAKEYPLYVQIEGLINQGVKIEKDKMDPLRRSVAAENQRALILMGGFVAASIGLALLLGFVISWSFILPVREAQSFLGRVATGDFGATIAVPNRDEFGVLADHLNRMSRERHRPGAHDAQRAAQAREHGQIGVSRQHEPRAPHPHERDPRIHRADARRDLWRDPALPERAPDRRPGQRQASAPSHQRGPRPLQDRGRAHGAQPGRILGPRHRGDRHGFAALARRRKGPGIHRPGRRGHPPGRRRWEAAHPVPHEPRGQRAQVHEGGAGGNRRRAEGEHAGLSRLGHGDRHPPGSDQQIVRRVPPARRHRRSRIRWDRARAQHHQEVRGAARGTRLGREPGRTGVHVLLLGPSARGQGEAGMSAKTILYVEDNEFNRKIVRDLLARTSYRLVEATDGEAGGAMALQESPNLILMDIQLPKISGLDATRRLRADPRTAQVPIIAITSYALSGDDQKALDAGASAYLAKPYSPRELLALIRKLAPES